MRFATAQRERERERPPEPRGQRQNPQLNSPLQWQTHVASHLFMCGDVQRAAASRYNEERSLTCACKLFIRRREMSCLLFGEVRLVFKN